MESRETQAARAHTGMRSLGAKKTSSFVYPELEGGKNRVRVSFFWWCGGDETILELNDSGGCKIL